MMTNKGGVSPIKLKASKAKSRRGGTEAGKATAKTQAHGQKWLGGRGGYKKSSGAQGTGVNRGGYNVHTRFQPRKTPAAPGSSGTTTPQKPYSFDKDGDIVINNYIDGKGGTGDATATATADIKLDDGGMTTGWDYKDGSKTVHVGSWDYDAEGRNPTYDEAWDLNLENIHKTYKTIEEYKRRRTDPDRAPNTDYEKPTHKEGGWDIVVKNGKNMKRPWQKDANGVKKYTGPWEEDK